MFNKSPPLAIIGLDGASFNLLDPLMAAGHMPRLQALRERGWQASLMSTQPPATLPAWTSFLTASSPAVHGVCDMFTPLPPSYRLQPTGGAMRAVPTFLRQLSAAGLQVASLGVPGTYPPEPVAGLCVAGFDAPGVRHVTACGVYPRAFFPTLQRLGGWRFATFNENAAGTGSRDHATVALLRDLDAKERVILHVLGMQRWDAFFVHLQASDTASHHLWHTYDQNSPRHTRHSDALPAIFARLDRLIGRIQAALPAACRLMVVSDHGMGGASDIAVYLNRWLHQQKLLQFKSASRRGLQRMPGAILRAAAARLPVGAMGATLRHLPPRVAGDLLAHARHNAVDYARSEAFSFELDYAPAIWINRRSAFAQGCLDDAQVPALVSDLAARLRAWRCPFTHAPMFDAVIPRDPDHPWQQRVPDLQLVPAWPGGYRSSFLASAGPGPAVCTLSAQAFEAPKGSGMPGVHRPAGIFLAHGPGLDPAHLPPLNIADAGALVYAFSNVAPPPYCDADHARVAQLWDTSRQMATTSVPASSSRHPYTPGQNHALLCRLADMGYI